MIVHQRHVATRIAMRRCGKVLVVLLPLRR
jgi:hypothetical protein